MMKKSAPPGVGVKKRKKNDGRSLLQIVETKERSDANPGAVACLIPVFFVW